MAVNVTIWQIPGHARSRTVCAAMMQGINRVGDRAIVRSAMNYRQVFAGGVGVFYGLAGRLANALGDYPSSGGTAVYIDLGYWGRKEGGRFNGYHKLSVNGRHPTAYFQKRRHSFDRAARFNLKPAPWRKTGSAILIAGMGPKGAAAEGFLPNQWEAEAVRRLRRYTNRPILYRPKPNWPNPPSCPGAVMQDPRLPLERALSGCHAVVAHHSNAAVEAITLGVPAFTLQGVALPMGLSDLSRIEAPVRPPGRRQWLADIAWTQFSVSEMAEGLPWRHLKEEGLVP